MGKKSKLFKSGLPRNQIKKKMEDKKKSEMIRTKINASKKENTTSSDNANKINKITTPQVNYNLDSLKKVNDSLGLTEEEIKSLYSRPLRNRRFVHNLVLTRREKKREKRKQRKELKMEMEEKTKLDITMNPNMHNKDNIMNKLGVDKNEKQKVKANRTTLNFDFGEMNDMIMDIEKNEENQVNNENRKNNVSGRVNKQKNFIYSEANKINNVLNDKEFLANPNQAMKMEIQENQKNNERNKKIREEFNQKYNLLNLK